jgi:SAM-dependent methyltransferase
MLEENLAPWMDAVGGVGGDVLEVGPGPGQTTDLLRRRAAQVTVVEIDQDLAEGLRRRLAGTNVQVQEGDAAATGFESDRFSAVTCFSVLHHLESAELQDRVLAELARVLRPGGTLLVTDSRDLEPIRDYHAGDTFVPLDPATLPSRLEAAGFTGISVEQGEYELRIHGTKPQA